MHLLELDMGFTEENNITIFMFYCNIWVYGLIVSPPFPRDNQILNKHDFIDFRTSSS